MRSASPTSGHQCIDQVAGRFLPQIAAGGGRPAVDQRDGIGETDRADGVGDDRRRAVRASTAISATTSSSRDLNSVEVRIVASTEPRLPKYAIESDLGDLLVPVSAGCGQAHEGAFARQQQQAADRFGEVEAAAVSGAAGQRERSYGRKRAGDKCAAGWCSEYPDRASRGAPPCRTLVAAPCAALLMNRARLLIFNAALGAARLPRARGDAGRAGLGGGRPARAAADRRDRLGARTAADNAGSGGRAAPADRVLPVPPIPNRCGGCSNGPPTITARRWPRWPAWCWRSGGALRGPSTVTEYRAQRRNARAADTAAAWRRSKRSKASRRRSANWPGVAGVSEGVLRGLVNQGVLEPVAGRLRPAYPPRPSPISPCPSCRPSSRTCRDRLVAAVDAAWLCPVPARRRDRIGQDRSLFRGRCRKPQDVRGKRLSCFRKSR